MARLKRTNPSLPLWVRICLLLILFILMLAGATAFVLMIPGLF